MVNQEHVTSVLKAIEYMKNNLDQNITTEQLAENAGYSPYHFTRIFKSVTGISPRQYLSALRIEYGKHEVLSKPSLFMKILLSIGFRSPGSFHTRFKQFVGLSPGQFRMLSDKLYAYMNQYEHHDLPLDNLHNDAKVQVICNVQAPASFKGIIFVGLFPRPIPDQKPVCGTAITRNNATCSFTDIPHGSYYALAAGIEWSLNPKDYFVLDKALRAKCDNPIEITDSTRVQISLNLRKPLPYDPPIVVSLPLLLFEKNSGQKKAK